jgi:hypothetical protein
LFLRLLTTALWIAVALAALAIVLVAPRPLPTWLIGFLLVPPVALAIGCLLLRGPVLISVGVIGVVATFVFGILAQLDERPDLLANYAWWYLFLAAVGVSILRALWIAIDSRILSLDRFAAAPDPVADLDAAHAAGLVSDAMYPFELAKLELARSGTRRLFRCGRCGKGISLAWKRCDHCKATFDQFPPIATGEEVGPEPDIIGGLSGWYD